MGEAPPGVEDYADGIENSASDKQRQRGGRNMRDHRLCGDEREPAHQDVARNRQEFILTRVAEFKNNAGHGDAPNDGEVKRRSGVEANERGAVNGASDDVPDRAAEGGKGDEDREAGDAEKQAG